MIIQPRGYKRENQSARLLTAIKSAVERDAIRYNCSKSFVVATILADHYGIKTQPNYVTYKPAKESSVKTRRSA